MASSFLVLNSHNVVMKFIDYHIITLTAPFLSILSSTKSAFISANARLHLHTLFISKLNSTANYLWISSFLDA